MPTRPASYGSSDRQKTDRGKQRQIASGLVLMASEGRRLPELVGT
jgi:hypothetical protein